MQEFTEKRNALFACLDDASKELKGTALDQSAANSYPISALDVQRVDKKNTRQIMHYRDGRSVNSYDDCGNDGKLKRMRGKESIFKKPELPIGRCLKPRKTPDYQVNPHKWKKYSLEDVDISDQTNSAAALSFLREMDAQREAMAEDPMEEPGQKIQFKKSSKLNRSRKQLEQNEDADVELSQPQVRDFKLVMPEYVIGRQNTKSRQKKSHSTDNNKKIRAAGTLTLSHLEEEEDEVDEQ